MRIEEAVMSIRPDDVSPATWDFVIRNVACLLAQSEEGAVRCSGLLVGVARQFEAFAKAQRAAVLEEAASSCSPDMDKFMDGRSNARPRGSVRDLYEADYEAHGDRWIIHEGLWGDCCVLWGNNLRALAQKERDGS